MTDPLDQLSEQRVSHAQLPHMRMVWMDIEEILQFNHPFLLLPGNIWRSRESLGEDST
ncbi:hypothetical protein PVOR_17854 [Paenibacillus vortex V453]|uniref:Uncharacterized protein n=1 Tax=Paenibacillus vortex V453 TaxID=715225 RepID=A0A2R9STT1_9BACL|nr:hypothetical protein PVOR_17854 [Paenibacillus vortex V453]